MTREELMIKQTTLNVLVQNVRNVIYNMEMLSGSHNEVLGEKMFDREILFNFLSAIKLDNEYAEEIKCKDLQDVFYHLYGVLKALSDEAEKNEYDEI